jgi:predicted nuclease with TOPRIM domain
MEIDDKLVKKLKDEHYEAVSIRHELEADLHAAHEDIKRLNAENTELYDKLESLDDTDKRLSDIYESMSSKRYSELFSQLSGLIYERIGRVI